MDQTTSDREALKSQLQGFAESLLQNIGEGSVTLEQISEATEKARRALDTISPGNTELLHSVAEEVKEELQVNWNIRVEDSAIVSDEGHEPWLTNAIQDRPTPYWDRYKKYIDHRLPHSVVTATDDTTSQILDHTADPKRVESFDKRGMVVGNVQSGKTANYTGLICKAVDMGYRIVIVIAGIDNALRKQTQLRLFNDFLGVDENKNISGVAVGGSLPEDVENVIPITGPEMDFNKTQAEGNFIDPTKTRLLFVVKKNVSVLRNLNEWISSWNKHGGRLTEVPMLVIDDEADHASINTEFNVDDPETDPSATNAQIRKLLKQGNKTSFVAYTATPFANVFIDPQDETEEFGEDLFPRNFIIGLEPPDNYLGGKKMFLDNQDQFISTVSDNDSFLKMKHKNGQEVGELPESLKDAIKHYYIATSVRKISEGAKGPVASSMLVHVSRFKSVQGAVREKVRSYTDTLNSSLSAFGGNPSSPNSEIQSLKSTFEKMVLGNEYAWEEVLDQCYRISRAIEVKLINGDSQDTLNYEERANAKQDAFFIAIGGQTLSRGITLEGLVTTYFLRNSKAYDTLMQMGRWFGYRDKYSSLVKVWMRPESCDHFATIARATDELFQELRRMNRENLTPKEFGIRVRTDPGSLIVTARNKSGFGEDQTIFASFDGQFPQVWLVDKDTESISSNLELANDLLEQTYQFRAAGTQFQVPTDVLNHPLKSLTGTYRPGVPSELVIDFISKFKYPKGISPRIDPGLINEHIKEAKFEYFDLFIPCLKINENASVLRKSGEKIQPDVGVKVMDRSFRNREQPDAYAVSTSAQINSSNKQGFVECLGLDVDHLRKFCKPNESGDVIISTSSARAARKGSNPLFIVYLLGSDAEHSVKGSPELACTFAVSFPTSNNPSEPVQYRVNKTYLEQLRLFHDEPGESQ